MELFTFIWHTAGAAAVILTWNRKRKLYLNIIFAFFVYVFGWISLFFIKKIKNEV